MGSAGAPDLHAGRDVDECKRCIDRGGQLGGQRRGMGAVQAQIHRAENVADRELARRRLLQVSSCPDRAMAFVQYLRCH